MIDPGHPFSVPYRELIEDFEERLRHGVEQPATRRFVYTSEIASYEIAAAVESVERVSGMAAGRFTVFEAGVHYRFGNNRIHWIHPTETPDEGSRVEVGYTFRERPSGLNDFNPGSVAGTLVRAMAREVKLLYEQVDEAYRRAFIDIASGVALDNVVALLGVERNPAQKAAGEVSFLVKKAVESDIPIPVHTRVADAGGRFFVTTVAGFLVPESSERAVAEGDRLRLAERVAEVVGIWPSTDDPETDPPLAWLEEGETPFGDDGRTVTLAVAPAMGTELEVLYRPASVTLPIAALEAGPDGNVNAGTIEVMPTPPTGIDGVTNGEPTTDGLEPEDDERLRQRAKNALERAGNATLNAIKFAVLDIDGVESVEVLDHSRDPAIPLGEVRVRYNGGDPTAVRREVDETRAAGVLAQVEEIRRVEITGVFYLIPEPDASAGAPAAFLAAVVESLDALDIAEPLSVRRLAALVYPVAGLADVAEARLSFRKDDPSDPGSELTGPVSDPFLVDGTELTRPAADLEAKLLDRLEAMAARTVAAGFEIDLRLFDEAGAAADFAGFELDLAVRLKARSQSAVDRPPAVFATLGKTVTFAGTGPVVVSLATAEITGFDPVEHQPEITVEIAAPAWPGIAAAHSSFEIGGS